MNFSKLFRACVAAVCLIAFVVGTTGCTNQPAKPPVKKGSGSNAT